MAFVTPSILAVPSRPFPSCSSSRVAAAPRRGAVMQASRVRPARKGPSFDDIPDLPSPSASASASAVPTPTPAASHAPEVAAMAATICEFMNREHVRDLSNYVVRFGRQFDDLSQLTAVRMTALDAAGFTADVVSCDESSHCVCVQERLDWPLGLCTNAADVINALKHLSMACGLPADF